MRKRNTKNPKLSKANFQKYAEIGLSLIENLVRDLPDINTVRQTFEIDYKDRIDDLVIETLEATKERIKPQIKVLIKLPNQLYNKVMRLIDQNLHIYTLLYGMHKIRPELYTYTAKNPQFYYFLINYVNELRRWLKLPPEFKEY